MHDERQRRDRLRALRLYTMLVRLYPKAHRQAFGVQMQQAFADHYRESGNSRGRVGVAFWLGVLVDAAWSIARERVAPVSTSVWRWAIWQYAPSGVILSGAVVATAAGDRRVLVCCALGATLAFALTRPTVIGPKVVTGLGVLGVVVAGILVAAVTGQWRDLLDPLLLLVTTLLVARTASGIWARQRGNRLPLRGREELLWGLLVTAGLHVSYTIAALPPQDAWVGLAILLGMGSTALCGGAGIRASRVGGSIEAGCYASVATLTIGLMLWLISLPLMIVLLTWSMSGAIPTIHALSHLAVPTGHPSTFWLQNLHVVPKYFPLLMLTGVTGGFFGAVCGYSPIVDESEQRRLAALSDAKPRGTCAGCGAQAWEDTTTCWSCGRRIVV